MTQKEKQLLIRDICARLPYELKVEVYIKDKDIKTVDCVKYGTVCTYIRLIDDENFSIKPYLRSILSMTEKEKIEYNLIKCSICSEEVEDYAGFIDWLNVNHFDYRGLIEKSLAIEAPKDMYEPK